VGSLRVVGYTYRYNTVGLLDFKDNLFHGYFISLKFLLSLLNIANSLDCIVARFADMVRLTDFTTNRTRITATNEW